MIKSPFSRGGRAGGLVVVLTTVLGLALLPLDGAGRPARAQAALSAGGQAADCELPGWDPEYWLHEYVVFRHGDLYYLVATYLGYFQGDPEKEKYFAYASSPDLCSWTDLGPVLADRPPDDWDGLYIWTPDVYEEGGTYYMFYTGVKWYKVQSIMLATSTNPADPSTWQRQGMVFQPTHPGSRWPGCSWWCDCRDPHVFKAEGQYYMYYTASDDPYVGIVGLATASSLYGPWTDLGGIVSSDASMPENATVLVHDGFSYLFYNDSQPPGLGEVYRIGESYAGPWSEPRLFRPGWAHEFFTGYDGEEHVSFLDWYDAEMRRLSWSTLTWPPRPWIGTTLYAVWVPLVGR